MAAKRKISDLEGSLKQIEDEIKKTNELLSEKNTLIATLNSTKKNLESGLNEIKNRVKSYSTVNNKKEKQTEFLKFFDDMKNIPEKNITKEEKKIVDDISLCYEKEGEEIEKEVINLEKNISTKEKELEDLKKENNQEQNEYENEKNFIALIDEKISFLNTLENKIKVEHKDGKYIKMYFLLKEFEKASNELIIDDVTVFEERLTEKFYLSVDKNDALANKSKEIDNLKIDLNEKKKDLENYKNTNIRIDRALEILSDIKSNTQEIDEIKKCAEHYNKAKTEEEVKAKTEQNE